MALTISYNRKISVNIWSRKLVSSPEPVILLGGFYLMANPIILSCFLLLKKINEHKLTLVGENLFPPKQDKLSQIKNKMADLYPKNYLFH